MSEKESYMDRYRRIEDSIKVSDPLYKSVAIHVVDIKWLLDSLGKAAIDKKELEYAYDNIKAASVDAIRFKNEALQGKVLHDSIRNDLLDPKKGHFGRKKRLLNLLRIFNG